MTDCAWRTYTRCVSLLAVVLVLALFSPALAQQEAEHGSPQAPAAAEENGEAEERALLEAVEDRRLPEASVTRHEVAFDNRTVRFSAVAGALTLTSASGRPEADIGFVAYLRETDEAAARPVTFALNGGPGAASAYLHLGVLGPWRLEMGVDNIVPSQSVDLIANPETWLDFTDLVFIDPVGTGFSRLVQATDSLRNRYLSVDGDIEALADFVYRWLVENQRMASPKYFIGESYGGFRGPRLADTLQTEHGVAFSGMTLVSPVLDFGWRQQPAYAPLPHVSLLPSLAAAGMEARHGEISPEALRAVENYAAGDYVTDLLRGVGDAAAVARITQRVAEVTGLDKQWVERYAGRIDRQHFVREILSDEDRIASLYDTGITADDPAPEQPFSRARDPVLDAMTAPLTSAMLAHYQETLEWLPERRYVVLNSAVNRAWRWGRGRSQPQAVTALRRVLALDREFRLLVVHGYTDLVTPYFETSLILRQMRDFGPGERVRQETYRGGHMFYTRNEARRAFREDAVRLYRARDE